MTLQRFSAVSFVLLFTAYAGDAGAALRRSAVRPILRHTAPTTDSQPKLPAGLTLVDWKQIKAEYERHRHGMFPDGKGGYQSRSHYHGWLARFDGKGFDVKPDTESWTWGLELVSWGRTGSEVAVSGKAEIHKEVNRLEYRRKGITEWFVNGKDGLEHGFTIPQRPEGSGGELMIQLRQVGDLVAGSTLEPQSIAYHTENGNSPSLHYRKLSVTDARGCSLNAQMFTKEGALHIVVDDRMADYPITVDPIVQQAYIKASNTGAGDRFGWSVSLSGDTVVVGAPYEDSNSTGVNGSEGDNSATDSGAAYVFVRSSNGWGQTAYLKASNTDAFDFFGGAVAISGDTLVVGAKGEDALVTWGWSGDQGDNRSSSSGAAYVFVRDGATWTQQAYLKAYTDPYCEWECFFGTSVAISGDTIVVGAPGEDNGRTGVGGGGCCNAWVYDSGAAFAFVRNGTVWTEQVYLKASSISSMYDTLRYNYFGTSVAVSGNTVVVGVPEARGGGAAYVFERSGTSWSQNAFLIASNVNEGDQFGVSVAVSGETVVVGAQSEDSNATGVNGTESDNNATNAGAAYVFVRNGANWSQQAYLKASNTEAGDLFGNSVALSGEILVVGALGEDSASTGVNGAQSDNSASVAGAAYFFVRNGAAWSQQGFLKASNTGASDFFAKAVAISGGTIVVSSDAEDSSARGANGSQNDDSLQDAGAVYAFAPVVQLAPSSISIAADSATGLTFLVNAESWLSWTGSSNSAWLTITNGNSGTGNGIVAYSAPVNPSINGRTGTLTIGGQTFMVTQSGATPTYAFASATGTAPATAGTGWACPLT